MSRGATDEKKKKREQAKIRGRRERKRREEEEVTRDRRIKGRTDTERLGGLILKARIRISG